jgi:hypothetical protein
MAGIQLKSCCIFNFFEHWFCCNKWRLAKHNSLRGLFRGWRLLLSCDHFSSPPLKLIISSALAKHLSYWPNVIYWPIPRLANESEQIEQREKVALVRVSPLLRRAKRYLVPFESHIFGGDIGNLCDPRWGSLLASACGSRIRSASFSDPRPRNLEDSPRLRLCNLSQSLLLIRIYISKSSMALPSIVSSIR